MHRRRQNSPAVLPFPVPLPDARGRIGKRARIIIGAGLLIWVAVAALPPRGVGAAPPPPPAATPAVPAAPETLALRGQVVWVAEALERQHGIRTVREASENQLALETASGELYPLVEDIRGRGFRRDPRLRGVDLELLVRRHRGSPMVQVIQIFELTENGRSELDYWCDICAIAMFELKACDCCQGPIELRRRPAEKSVIRAGAAP